MKAKNLMIGGVALLFAAAAMAPSATANDLLARTFVDNGVGQVSFTVADDGLQAVWDDDHADSACGLLFFSGVHTAIVPSATYYDQVRMYLRSNINLASTAGLDYGVDVGACPVPGDVGNDLEISVDDASLDLAVMMDEQALTCGDVTTPNCFASDATWTAQECDADSTFAAADPSSLFGLASTIQPVGSSAMTCTQDESGNVVDLTPFLATMGPNVIATGPDLPHVDAVAQDTDFVQSCVSATVTDLNPGGATVTRGAHDYFLAFDPSDGAAALPYVAAHVGGAGWLFPGLYDLSGNNGNPCGLGSSYYKNPTPVLPPVDLSGLCYPPVSLPLCNDSDGGSGPSNSHKEPTACEATLTTTSNTITANNPSIACPGATCVTNYAGPNAATDDDNAGGIGDVVVTCTATNACAPKDVWALAVLHSPASTGEVETELKCGSTLIASAEDPPQSSELGKGKKTSGDYVCSIEFTVDNALNPPYSATGSCNDAPTSSGGDSEPFGHITLHKFPSGNGLFTVKAVSWPYDGSRQFFGWNCVDHFGGGQIQLDTTSLTVSGNSAQVDCLPPKVNTDDGGPAMCETVEAGGYHGSLTGNIRYTSACDGISTAATIGPGNAAATSSADSSPDENDGTPNPWSCNLTWDAGDGSDVWGFCQVNTDPEDLSSLL